MPDIAEFKKAKGANWTKAPAAVKDDGGQKKLLVNYAHFRIHDRAKGAADNAASGYWSSGDEDHVFLHELGHVLHGKVSTNELTGSRGGFDSPDAKAIAAKVSKRAAEDPEEFVAETFAGMLAGKRYQSDVMELYAKHGGPMPKAAQ